MMEKKSCKCAETIKQLKADLERMAEEKGNIETINQSHKETNGDLQVKLTDAEKKIKDYEDNYIKIDGKK